MSAKHSLALVFVGFCIGFILGDVLFDAPFLSQQQQQQTQHAPLAVPTVCGSAEPESPSSANSALVATAQASTLLANNRQQSESTASSAIFGPNVFVAAVPDLWKEHCDSVFDVAAIRKNYRKMREEETALRHLFAKSELHRTAEHLNATFAFLRSAVIRGCWARITAHRRKEQQVQQRAPEKKRFLFYDLGSRKLDQTENFLRLYPAARQQYSIVCYEPNPKFRALYPPVKFVSTDRPQIYHVGAAIGIADDVLLLSDRDVGSSIVREQRDEAGLRSASAGAVNVKVVPFLDALLIGVVPTNLAVALHSSNSGSSAVSSLLHPTPHRYSDHVIVKMDIEKAEFGVIHQLARSGALSLISELLLECHYNTNLPREKRDPMLHIGLDDCVQLVNDIRAASGGTMEVVLWNNKKTAAMTGRSYMERKGGFFPT